MNNTVGFPKQTQLEQGICFVYYGLDAFFYQIFKFAKEPSKEKKTEVTENMIVSFQIENDNIHMLLSV